MKAISSLGVRSPWKLMDPFGTFWRKAGGFEFKFGIEIYFLQSFLNYNRKLQNRINSHLGEG